MVEVVRLEAVSVRYGAESALTDVTLTVRAGERVALVGPSGAGKSSLLALCTGAVPAAYGRVRVLGADPRQGSQRQLATLRRRIGTIHQQLHLVGRLRVVHNVNAGRLGYWPWPLALLSLGRPLHVDAARRALDRMGIEHKLTERTDRLSGGEQQRVALARVLVQEPDLVLADEPVSSLDPARAEEVMRLLCETVAAGHRALLVSLHDFDLALRHCDRLVGLRAGRVVFDVPVDQVDETMRRRLYALEVA